MNSFNQIHHLEASFSKDFGGQLKWNKEEYLKMKELETLSFSMASGAFKGSAAGAVTAFGAYGGAMTFGAASTGTAIASFKRSRCDQCDTGLLRRGLPGGRRTWRCRWYHGLRRPGGGTGLSGFGLYLEC